MIEFDHHDHIIKNRDRYTFWSNSNANAALSTSLKAVDFPEALTEKLRVSFRMKEISYFQ